MQGVYIEVLKSGHFLPGPVDPLSLVNRRALAWLSLVYQREV